MKTMPSRTAAVLAAVAVLSLAATPAEARHRHRHHRGVDAGDVFAGLLIVGGIAAIATAASKSKRDRDAREAERFRDYPEYRRDYPYDRRDNGARYVPPADEPFGDGEDYADRPITARGAGIGIDAAVDACVAEVERDDRQIDSVDAVDRQGDGWRVAGQAEGLSFACAIDGDGRVSSLSGL